MTRDITVDASNPNKATIVDNDRFPMVDSESSPQSLKEVLWSLIKSTLKTYFDALYTGIVVQKVSTQTGAVATGTTLIPLDDTIPQNTEGNQYMSLSVTPTKTTNFLNIDVTFIGSSDVANPIIVALFQDSVANALASAMQTNAAGYASTITFRHKMTAGTISPITFKVRAGQAIAGTLTFNGFSGARYFGGVLASSIKITETTS